MTAAYSLLHQGVCCNPHPPQRQPLNSYSTRDLPLFAQPCRPTNSNSIKDLNTLGFRITWQENNILLILSSFVYGITFSPIKSILVQNIACICDHIWKTLFDSVFDRISSICPPKFTQVVPFNEFHPGPSQRRLHYLCSTETADYWCRVYIQDLYLIPGVRDVSCLHGHTGGQAS